MKKGLSACISCLLVLMLSVSFSLPVKAASVANDTQVGFESVVWSSSSVFNGQESRYQIYLDFPTSRHFETSSWCRINFASTVPAGSRIDFIVSFNIISYFLSGETSEQVDGVLYTPDYKVDLLSPGVKDTNISSIIMPIKAGYHVSCYCSFTTTVPVSTAYLDFDYGFNIKSIREGDYMFQFYLGDSSVFYYAVDNNPNADVLEQIKNNTEATKEAIDSQTGTLTNGFDNSGMIDTNAQLSGAIDDYDKNQDAITNDSVGFIDAVEFFNPSNSPPILAGITLCGSFLQSLFVNLGDWSSVVLVSLSLTFGLMLVGWFKFRK